MASIILLGATGEVGKYALLSALRSNAISKVASFGRSAPSNVDATTEGYSKLVHTALDYEALLQGSEVERKKLSDVEADSIVVAMGTTRALAGGAEAFVKIDREYVVAAAKAAKVEGKTQSLVYCSSTGSSSSSPFLYPQSKGLTEEALAGLGFTRTTILRPGFLDVPGGRERSRLLENLFSVIPLALAKVSSSVAASTPAVGSAMIKAALGQVEGAGHSETLKGELDVVVLNNREILQLTES